MSTQEKTTDQPQEPAGCSLSASAGSGILCPECGEDMEHNDTFGNLDYCLDAIGHPRDAYSRRNPIRAGDIYRCNQCDEWRHTFDGDTEVHDGYPC